MPIFTDAGARVQLEGACRNKLCGLTEQGVSLTKEVQFRRPNRGPGRCSMTAAASLHACIYDVINEIRVVPEVCPDRSTETDATSGFSAESTRQSEHLEVTRRRSDPLAAALRAEPERTGEMLPGYSRIGVEHWC